MKRLQAKQLLLALRSDPIEAGVRSRSRQLRCRSSKRVELRGKRRRRGGRQTLETRGNGASRLSMQSCAEKIGTIETAPASLMLCRNCIGTWRRIWRRRWVRLRRLRGRWRRRALLTGSRSGWSPPGFDEVESGASARTCSGQRLSILRAFSRRLRSTIGRPWRSSGLRKAASHHPARGVSPHPRRHL